MWRNTLAKNEYKIPFDHDGNQLHYPDYKRFEMRDNYVFEDTLEFRDYSRGRSAAYFNFAKESDGREVTVFLKDFCEIVKYMINGKITGKFTFTKRGENYGCKLVK